MRGPRAASRVLGVVAMAKDLAQILESNSRTHRHAAQASFRQFRWWTGGPGQGAGPIALAQLARPLAGSCATVCRTLQASARLALPPRAHRGAPPVHRRRCSPLPHRRAPTVSWTSRSTLTRWSRRWRASLRTWSPAVLWSATSASGRAPGCGRSSPLRGSLTAAASRRRAMGLPLARCRRAPTLPGLQGRRRQPARERPALGWAARRCRMGALPRWLARAPAAQQAGEVPPGSD